MAKQTSSNKWEKWENWDKKGGRIKIENQLLGGGLWFIGWLFTIGFVGLTFGQGLLAIVIWPYYLGKFIIVLMNLNLLV